MPDEPTRQPEIHKRRPLRPEKLHAPSRRWHDFIATHRPHWLERAFNVLGYEHDEFDLEVEVPHPKAGRPIGHLRLTAEPLSLWMNGGVELSLSYWLWHTHIGCDDQDPSTFAKALAMVDAITTEQRTFSASYASGRLTGAGSCPAHAADEIIARHLQVSSEMTTCVIRSWNGTHDRRVER